MIVSVENEVVEALAYFGRRRLGGRSDDCRVMLER